MLHLREFLRTQCPDVASELVERHLRCLPPGYFERHAAAEIVRHLRLLAHLSPDQRVAVEVRPLAPHTFETLLVGEDFTGTVACITAAMAAAHFNLEDLQVHSYLQTTEEQESSRPPYFVIVLRISGNLKGQTPADFAVELRDRLQAAFTHLALGNFLEAQTVAADTRIGPERHSTPRHGAPPSIRRRQPGYEDLIVGGDFRLERKLASGGVGVVYLATQLSLGRMVAVKLFQHSGAADDELLVRFTQESRVLAQFSCPQIVPVLAANTIPDEDGGVLAWMAMEYLSGGDLARWQQQHGCPPATQAARWFRQALEGLHYAHRRGILHRDLKPHNLLLTNDGQVKISDFGLLKQAQPSSDLTPQAILLGTPHYMAPEQALGEAVDERADIFSLGTTFFHLLSGRLPFQRDSLTALLVAIAQQDAPRLLDVMPEAPLPMAVIINRMMARRREERYQDVGVILEDLTSYERRGLVEASSCNAPPPPAIPRLVSLDETRTYRLTRDDPDDVVI